MSSLIEQQLRERARDLLAEGRVDVFLGYRQGSSAARVAPFVARTTAEVEKLVWNPACIPNLAGALRKHAGRRIGVLLKACDARSVVALLRLNQLSRERLYIVGVGCSGMGEPLLAKCATCAGSTPELYDELLDADAPAPAPTVDRFAPVREFAALDTAARFAFWSEQLSRCTLCYACQAVCPLCFCKQCALTLERDDPRRQTREPASVFAYHLMRAYHLAERCTGCDECERVCPEAIPLSLICRYVEAERLSASDRPGELPGSNIREYL